MLFFIVTKTPLENLKRAILTHNIHEIIHQSCLHPDTFKVIPCVAKDKKYTTDQSFLNKFYKF